MGTIDIADQLTAKTGLPVQAVYGNIDGQDVRTRYPEQLVFMCEEVKVMMRHIGGLSTQIQSRNQKRDIDPPAPVIHQWPLAYPEDHVR